MTNAAAPPIKLQEQFQIPLTDGSSGNAIALQTADGNLTLIICTKEGKISLLTIKTIDNQPPVPPPPPPPIGGKLKRVIIIENPMETTISQRQVLSDERWKSTINDKSAVISIIPIDLIDPETRKPPKELEDYIRDSEGKQLPYIFFIDQNKNRLKETTLPGSTTEMIALIAEIQKGETTDVIDNRSKCSGAGKTCKPETRVGYPIWRSRVLLGP